MNIAVGAIFQNSTRYIDRFVAQYYSLVAYAPEHAFEPILVEGDSTDGNATWDKLQHAFKGHVTKREHGGQVFKSVDDPQRWRQVSYACDGVLEQIRPEHDALLWVEADLIWEATTAFKLIQRLSQVSACCAMIMRGNAFYDTWSFRKNGTHFSPNPPYHPCLRAPSPTYGLASIDSGGAFWAARGDVVRTCRYRPPELSIVGFWQEAARLGHRLWVDPKLIVHHP